MTLSYVERAQFLAAVQEMGEGDEIAAATFALFREMESTTPAPWAATDPFAAERYLAARGAAPAVAAENAAEFELNFRALIAMATGEPVRDFQQITAWITEHVDASP